MNFPDFLNGFPEHYLLNFKEARGEKVCYGASRFSPADITALSGQTKLKLLLLLLLLLWNGLKHDFGTSILRPDFRSLSSKILITDPESRPDLAASKFRKFWRFATFEYRFPNYSWLVFLLTEHRKAQQTCRRRTPSPWSRSWFPPGAFSNRPPQKSEIMNEVWQDDNWLKLKSNLKVIHHQVWNWRCGAHEELLGRGRNC